ncbi:MAG TPA: SDR family oxidoreductase [Nocardioides sp.]|jgi:NAD(P)-dependent dehydrogenase (short-subunit alcohol dehydrogenase family)|uniref:SDR family NAD(P)-dependent oxidoreductase n=1 Tax=Nocardioides sp. TaxID=35761 RepID=UPI002C8B161B|nr:SDR family oxidoreductase [Nocardioides sp.]HTW15411.1 SDR family oxidoreductase [Nocardioides sp.]
MGVLEGRVAIVTGAARGVGAGIARAFAKEGARVVVVDLDEEGAAGVVAELTPYAEALALRCDIRDSAQVDACVASVVARFGSVDVLVNNAIDAVSARFEETTDDELDRVLDTGPKATLYFMRACFAHLRDSGYGGRVINLRSGSEPQGLAGFGAYVASKAAVAGLTRVAAREWGRHGITVNNLAPFVLSEGARSYFDERPEELEKIILKTMSVPRLGDAEHDVGRAAVYLAGPDASYVTGVTLSVDGGGSFFS